MAENTSPADARCACRWQFLALAFVSSVAMMGELLLMDHAGSLVQKLPIIACGVVAAMSVLLLVFRRAKGPVRIVVMLAALGCVGVGAFGTYEHFEHNNQYARDVLGEDASMMDILKKTMLNAEKPPLAPGAVSLCGLLLGLGAMKR